MQYDKTNNVVWQANPGGECSHYVDDFVDKYKSPNIDAMQKEITSWGVSNQSLEKWTLGTGLPFLRIKTFCIVVPITNTWILFWNQEMNLSSLKNKRQFVTLVLTESNLSTSSLVSVDLLFIYSLQWRLVQWARWRLKSPASVFTQPFIQAQMKENIKALRHWPLWGEFTGDKGPIMREMFPFDDVIMHDD